MFERVIQIIACAFVLCFIVAGALRRIRSRSVLVGICVVVGIVAADYGADFVRTRILALHPVLPLVLPLALLLIGLTLQIYLNFFWQAGRLPYSWGYVTISILFAITFTVMLVWSFGILIGVLLTALCLLQVPQLGFLWMALLPWYWRTRRLAREPSPSLIVLGLFGACFLEISRLTIETIAENPYRYGLNAIADRLWFLAGVLLVVVLVGNLARRIVMAKVMQG